MGGLITEAKDHNRYKEWGGVEVRVRGSLTAGGVGRKGKWLPWVGRVRAQATKIDRRVVRAIANLGTGQ
jgi:hypothetical protein